LARQRKTRPVERTSGPPESLSRRRPKDQSEQKLSLTGSGIWSKTVAGEQRKIDRRSKGNSGIGPASSPGPGQSKPPRDSDNYQSYQTASLAAAARSDAGAEKNGRVVCWPRNRDRTGTKPRGSGPGESLQAVIVQIRAGAGGIRQLRGSQPGRPRSLLINRSRPGRQRKPPPMGRVMVSAFYFPKWS